MFVNSSAALRTAPRMLLLLKPCCKVQVFYVKAVTKYKPLQDEI